MSLLLYLVQLRREVTAWFGWVSGLQPGLNHHSLYYLFPSTLLYFFCILQSNTFSQACYIFYRFSVFTLCPGDLQLSSYLLQSLGGSRHSSVLTAFQSPHFRGSTPALCSQTFVTPTVSPKNLPFHVSYLKQGLQTTSRQKTLVSK